MEAKITDLLTKQDLGGPEDRIVKRIAEEINSSENAKIWVRSRKVQELLSISSSGLQNLRVAGLIPYSRIQGSLYYNYEDILRILEDNKIDHRK